MEEDGPILEAAREYARIFAERRRRMAGFVPYSDRQRFFDLHADELSRLHDEALARLYELDKMLRLHPVS